MAKASKETITIRPAQEAIAAKPAITEDVIHLQLSKEEAIALITVLDVVGGDGRCSDRQYIDNIYIALDSAAVRYDENALDRNYKPVVRFRDWSEYKATPEGAIAEKQEFKFKVGERVFIEPWAEYGEIVEYPVDSCYKGMYKVEVYFAGCGIYNFFESSLRKTSQES